MFVKCVRNKLGFHYMVIFDISTVTPVRGDWAPQTLPVTGDGGTVRFRGHVKENL